MFPDWLIRSLESGQAVFHIPTDAILGIGMDTVVHFTLTLLIVALAVGRGRVRLGLGICAALALAKEALDLSILVHYRDVRINFVFDTFTDLLAAAAAMGVGVVISKAMLGRHPPGTSTTPE